MADQADSLRRMVAGTRETGKAAGRARSVALISGRGGVGKTNLAASLAVLLGRAGRRVVLVDCDFGLANVDLLFEVDPPHNISHVLSGEKEVRDCLTHVADGVRILAGVNGVARLANLEAGERTGLLERLAAIETEADLVLFDAGCGVGDNVMEVAAMADAVLLVTVPEPTATWAAYASAKVLARREQASHVGLVVNRAAHRGEAERVAGKLGRVVKEHLGVELHPWGYVLEDPHVPVAVKRQRPFVQEFPRCPAAACLERVAERLGDGADPAPPGGVLSRLSSWFR